MENKSIWVNDNNYSTHKSKKFNSNSATDILIIGGGITGLTLAYLLKDSNYSVSLIDRTRIGYGVTSKSTAKITYLQGTIYQKLFSKFNYYTSHLYYKSQVEAINIIKDIISDNDIDCDLTNTPSIIFTLKDKNIKKINYEEKLLNRFNVKTSNITNCNKVKAGIKVNDTYCFNPIKYLNGLYNLVSDKINIYENITAFNIKKFNDFYYINTSSGVIKSKIVIVACHYPFFVYPSFTPFKAYVKREYVSAGRCNNNCNYSAISIDNKLHSVRFYNDYAIYVSNMHKITNKTNYSVNYNKNIESFNKIFNSYPEYFWMNQDIISYDNLPFIGAISDNLYIATAFNSWGMTNGTISAKVISDLILNNNSPYKKLFNPNRINLNLVFSSFFGSFFYIFAYIRSLFFKNNPHYIKIKDLIYGIYTDKFNITHSIKLICPHMKCNLVFNKKEKTWDCPCHGSRFDLDGNVISGPSVDNLCNNKKEKKH